jgi:hypothetical protein
VLKYKKIPDGAYTTKDLKTQNTGLDALVPPGDYEVVITLTKADGKTAGRAEVAQIYSGLETSAVFTFNSSDFVIQKYLQGTAAIRTPSGLAVNPTVTAHTDVSCLDDNKITNTADYSIMNTGSVDGITTYSWSMKVPVGNTAAYLKLSATAGGRTFTAVKSETGIPDTGRPGITIPQLNIYGLSKGTMTNGDIVIKVAGTAGSYALAGDSISLTTDTTKNYMIKKDTLKKNNSTTGISGSGPYTYDSVYTFTMPAEDTQITSEFVIGNFAKLKNDISVNAAETTYHLYENYWDGSVGDTGATISGSTKKITIIPHGTVEFKRTVGGNAMFSVADGATLTLGKTDLAAADTLVLDGNKDGPLTDTRGSLVNVTGSGSSLTMHPGVTLQKNIETEGGGVKVGSGASFTMKGGSIINNTATVQGGGVSIQANGTFTMNAGSITGNIAGGGANNRGDGVYIGSDGTFDMKGGIITGNSSSDNDSYGMAVYHGGMFTMSGTVYISKIFLVDNTKKLTLDGELRKVSGKSYVANIIAAGRMLFREVIDGALASTYANSTYFRVNGSSPSS